MKDRTGRVGEEIRRIISDLLLRELKDPRLSGIVSISAVEVTSDLSYVTVYITILGDNLREEADQARKDQVLEAFHSAKGLIRREIGRQIKLRHVPDLVFKFDTSLEYGRHITKVIQELGIRSGEDGDNEE